MHTTKSKAAKRAAVFAVLWNDPTYVALQESKDKHAAWLSLAEASAKNVNLASAQQRLSDALQSIVEYEDAALKAAGL